MPNSEYTPVKTEGNANYPRINFSDEVRRASDTRSDTSNVSGTSNASTVYKSPLEFKSDDDKPLSVLFPKQPVETDPVKAVSVQASPASIMTMADARKLIERSRTYVFDGSNIEEFLTHIKFGLIRDGFLYSMVSATKIKTEYWGDTQANRDALDKYNDFCNRNAEALAYIVDHLSARVLLRVKNSVTAFKMHNCLKTLIQTSTDIGRDAARATLFGLKYFEGQNMAKYIEKYERAADNFRDLGGEFSDREEIKQFRTLLPATFNDVRKWFSTLPLDLKTFNNLKRQVMEDAEYRGQESGSNFSGAFMVQLEQFCTNGNQRQNGGNGRNFRNSEVSNNCNNRLNGHFFNQCHLNALRCGNLNQS